MSDRHRRMVVIAAVVLMTVPSVARLSSQTNGTSPAAKEWPTVSGDLANTRYSTLTQINTQTIGQLSGAWISPKLKDVAVARSTPVMEDGLLFITAGSAIYALDAKTGELVWRHQPGASTQPGTRGPLFSGVPAPGREGVAVGQGLVFVGLFDGSVIAVREKTGEPVWSTYVGVEPRFPGQGISGAPVYANGLVFVGTSADAGFRGEIVALDAATGRKVWEWFVVPGPGEPGHETWPKDNDSWKTGGGAVWLVGAADPELGLVYFGTGNGVPQFSGEVRPGNNLYLCSIVALDMKTGKLRWHYQTIRHDIWEADVAMSPVLFDAQIGGRPRKGVAAMRTDGYLFLLDRKTGERLLPVEERKVSQDRVARTAPTQPFPVGADRVLPDCDEWEKEAIPSGFVLGCFFTAASTDRPNLLTPSWGMRVTPMSFSPQTGYFYAIGNTQLTWFRRVEDPYFFTMGVGRVPGLPPGRAIMAAIDSRTDRIVWKKEFRDGRPGAALTTAGGLMFQMMSDGNFSAFDPKTGNALWQFQTGVAGAAAPPISYEIAGEQYLAIVLRNNLWAFKLRGPLKPEPAPRPIPPPDAIQGFTGPIQDTNEIEVASAVKGNTIIPGQHFWMDEYAFSVYRARVKVGTSVRWVNNGRMVHTVAAEDGSWATPRLNPIEVGVLKFAKPGTYTYMCKEHPWAKAQLIVVE